MCTKLNTKRPKRLHTGQFHRNKSAAMLRAEDHRSVVSDYDSVGWQSGRWSAEPPGGTCEWEDTVPFTISPSSISRSELNRYCSARFRSSLRDFPEQIKAMSKIRVTTYVPTLVANGRMDGEDDLFGDSRRSNLLPPLESARPPKGIASSFDSSSSDNRTYRKVSVAVERRIVTHLKEHLNKRTGTRYSNINSPSVNNSDISSHRGHLKSASSLGESRDIFSNYTELGEKILPRKKGVHNANVEPPINVEIFQENVHDDVSESGSNDDSAISDSDTDAEYEENTNTGDKALSGSSLHDGNTLWVEPVQAEDDDSTIDGDFKRLIASPVKTPTAQRPQTQEHGAYTFKECENQILNGIVHKTCPRDNTVVNLYIASGTSDFEAERAFLQEHLYPKLREHYKQLGHELRILDLHWGFKDSMWDDHKVPEVIKRAIAKAQQSSLGTNFVIMIGQKYGNRLLPAEIPRADFEAIHKAAGNYRTTQTWLHSIRMAEIEAQKAERERELSTLTGEVSTAQGKSSGSSSSSDVTGEQKAEAEPVELQAVDEKRRRRSVAIKQEQVVIRGLKEAEDQLPDLDSLTQWYLLDTNAVPAVYRLQNISTVYKDILRNDAVKRGLAKSSFQSMANKLFNILLKFAPDVLDDQTSFDSYTSSVFGMEIGEILEQESAHSHILCLTRTIDSLVSHLDDTSAPDYLDLTCDRTPTLDTEAWEKVQQMRKDIYKGKIPEKNISNILLDWIAGGIRPGGRREHTVHVERVSKLLHDSLVHHLDQNLPRTETKSSQTDLFVEVAEHVRFCHEKANKFQGRKDILTLTKSYLKSESRSPLVVYGKTGSGKSAILGKTAKEIVQWLKRKDIIPHVLVRMIGCTINSTNVRVMLRDICVQLCHIFHQNPADVPMDYKGVVNDITWRIGQASKERPLILILDAVDRLSAENDGRKLQWLPPVLPPHVKLIISTISDDKYECLPAARKLLGGNDDCFLEVGQLPEDDAFALLSHWLDCAHRTLTDHQFDVFLEAFKKCPYPLYLKVAFAEVSTWTSYMKEEWIKLGETVKKLTTLRFGRLERDHGEPLVRRALGYITATRNGLTSNEMEDLLSLDDAVMDDAVATHKLSKRRLPPLLWVRLLDDIEDLLIECRADNVKTIRWAHGDIFDAAEERYLVQRDKAPSYHKALAEYFSGQWAGKCKPFTGSEKGMDRFVSKQELFFEPGDTAGDGSSRVYNLRTINELPFHLLRAQLTLQLKQACLCNFEWMLAKLCGTSLTSLLEEYQAILATEPQEAELKMLSEVLHLSGKALRCDPRQLASQLIGRLTNIITLDSPKIPGDPRKYPNLNTLLSAAKQSSIPALIPSITCLAEPGGILFDLLSGHTEPITAMTLTTDGQYALTTSRDRTLKLWNVRSGKVIKSIEGMSPNVSSLRTAKANSLAITVECSVIKIWSLETDTCLCIIDKNIDPPSIAIASDGNILVAVFDGSILLRSWNLETYSILCEANIPDNSIHKDHSILIADSSHGDKVLHAFRSANFATVQNVRNGEIIKNLQCHDQSSAVVALAISKEYYIVCCRQQNVTLNEIHTLELFDAANNAYIRSIRGCPLDNISYLFVNLAGSHAIAVSVNRSNNMSDVALFNLETEDHKHLARHPGVSTMGACLDFRFCFTGAEGENSLRIWDLSAKVNQPAPKLKKQCGVAEIWPMVDNPRYVVARGINHGPVSVWNIAKGKCLQSAVRIGRGLSESTDAMVMRNTNLVILTDRGMSTVTDDSRPVFQTVLTYDLTQMKYTRNLTSCYIVPGASNEYVLLDNDNLLGLSDNRSHFIIWSLQSGHAVARIKTAFKELERRRMGGSHVLTVSKPTRSTSASMTPWDRRAETQSARHRRHEIDSGKEKQRLDELRKEKDNVIEQFLISGDQKIIVASFYAHHLCVFDISTKKHIQTLQTEFSMMFLHNAALTYDGSHLVHANYDEESKISYVTLWDCMSGEVKRRLKRETNVAAIAITDDAQRIVIGRAPNELHIWDPMKTNSLRRIRGYEGLNFETNAKIFIIEEGRKAVVFAGDISMWDLEKATALAVFTPDTRITVCNVVLGGQLIVFGMYDRPDLVILRLMSGRFLAVEDAGGVDLFGEKSGDTTDEEEENEEREKSSEKK
ncbi:unnamed protein product [Lymnaea stagnalis]|uniref:Uncharacterized protein n=1 Tax=Lymnaea stagnalis TaxID=6523 RepID=A0AAV2H864_LYMST